MIDSLTGFLHAMPEQQQQLIVQLHKILTYLGNFGVLTFLIVPTWRCIAPANGH